MTYNNSRVYDDEVCNSCDYPGTYQGEETIPAWGGPRSPPPEIVAVYECGRCGEVWGL